MIIAAFVIFHVLHLTVGAVPGLPQAELGAATSRTSAPTSSMASRTTASRRSTSSR